MRFRSIQRRHIGGKICLTRIFRRNPYEIQVNTKVPLSSPLPSPPTSRNPYEIQVNTKNSAEYPDVSYAARMVVIPMRFRSIQSTKLIALRTYINVIYCRNPYEIQVNTK